MSATPSKLLGTVIRLVMREAAGWKAAGGAAGAGAANGSASSTSASAVLEAKNEAEAELKRLLNSGLDAESILGGCREALLAGINALFQSLCDPLALAAVSPSRLADSGTLAVLSLIRAAIKGPTAISSSLASLIINAAHLCFKRASSNKEQDIKSADAMAGLIDYFVSEVCEKAWAVEDAWNDVEVGDDFYSPLEVAAFVGSLPLVRVVLECAKNADICQGARAAYLAGHPAVFDLLIQTERCLSRKHQSLVEFLFSTLPLMEDKDRELGSRCEDMLESFLRKWPRTTETLWSAQGQTCRRALEAAIYLRSVKLVNTVLGLGCPIRYDRSEEVVDGKTYVFYPTAFYGLRWPSLPVMKILVERRVFEDWGTKYSEKALQALGTGLGATLLSCYPPIAPSSLREEAPYRLDGLDTLSLVLSTGFSYSWGVTNDGLVRNTCLGALLPEGAPFMSEDHIVDLLLRCRAAGMDILHLAPEDVGKMNTAVLAGRAASKGMDKLLDLAVKLQGPESVNDWIESFSKSDGEGKLFKSTPLLEAISQKQLATAQHLLRVYKAKAAYRGVDLQGEDRDQPIMEALGLKDDEAALPFVQELIKADPTLCDLECFFLLLALSTPACTAALSLFPGVWKPCYRLTFQA
jgi:hypothetical protein